VLAYVTAFLGIFTLGLLLLGSFQMMDSRAVQRAHVFVIRPAREFVMHENAIIGMRLGVVWKNSGVTPATEVNLLMVATWVPEGGQFVFGDINQENVVRQPIALAPGAEFASEPIGISAFHFMQNIERRGAQFLWGWARYRDIFPRSRVHVLEFCFHV